MDLERINLKRFLDDRDFAVDVMKRLQAKFEEE